MRHGLEDITNHADARKRMIIILCGPIMGSETWDEVPSWPLHPNASTDEHNLAALADWLDLDRRGFEAVWLEALNLTLTREFHFLHRALTGLLDHRPTLGPELVAQVETITRRVLCST